ncbi:retained isoform X2 [Musca autumnalis]|uniref:retained isoform X2 n=1 Tax=Musca autumnalis TaxID=221902 RepID=UPI003CEFB11F
MQLNTMDCAGRSSAPERETDLVDDMSHELHSDDELRDCDSDEGDHMTRVSSRLNASMTSNGGGDISGHEHNGEMQMSHHHQFPANHPLNALNNFMGMGGLHGIPSLQHNDVLEKLKMQVRDMKVGLMDQEYAAAHAAAFGANVLSSPINTAFSLPPTTMASFTHAAQTLAAQASNNLNSHINASTPTAPTPAGAGPISNGNHNNSSNFSFTSPTAPNPKDVNPASNSSTSSETSNSSQQNNGWSFEEQYKQVRQLYEINDDPKRKEFLDDLFSFMQKRGTPINRLPIMAKSVLDLYELYNLVIARGGLVDVINKKLWQEIIKGLHLPSSITSAAFTLRTQYMKYLYPYECEKKNLSTPAELQAAIDGNRREGRRSSYGQYEAMHNQMQMPPLARQALPGGMQQMSQMSPLALVTHAAAANNQQAQAAAAAAAAHHRLMAPTFGQVPNLVTQEIEQRMIEYLKLIQVKKEQNAMGNGSAGIGLSPHHQQHQQHQQRDQQQQHQQQQQQRQRSQSPEISPREALNALEMSRVALWQMYHNNTSPPASEPKEQMLNTSEALNLSDSPPGVTTIKREREREPSPDITEREDFHHQPPPAKRAGFPTNFYLPHATNMAAAAAAVNFHYKSDNQQDSDAEGEDENEDEGDHNTTANSSHDDTMERQQLNGMPVRPPRHHGSNSSVHNDKSDDSAIENSPSTSAASAGNEHISPVSTKKIHLSKQHSQHQGCELGGNDNDANNSFSPANSALNPLDALNLLSGMQFRVTRNGTNENGEQQLVVNLELNGVKYSGLLVANTNKNTPSSTSTPTTASAKDKESNENLNRNSSDLCSRNETTSPALRSSHSLEVSKTLDTTLPQVHELTMHDSDTIPINANHTSPSLTNGPNAAAITS